MVFTDLTGGVRGTVLLWACGSTPRNEKGDLVGVTARVDGHSWKATLTRDVMGREVDRQLPGGGRSYIVSVPDEVAVEWSSS